MSKRHEPATWQEFLGQLIGNPYERERLATAVRVRSITLQRWARGSSKPRGEHLHELLKHLPPETRPHFLNLLLAEFPEFRQERVPEERFHQGIAAEFYAHALSDWARMPQAMYRQSMRDLLLQQALRHLDPDRRGLSLTLVVCMPPRSGNKVRSLREWGRLGTPPWPGTLSEKPLFLGAEALVGYAIKQMRTCVINSLNEIHFFPVGWIGQEQSIAACPILRQSRIVGGLRVCSIQEGFFTQSLISVIEEYAHLAASMFEREDSYHPDEIELCMMPPYELQLPYFSAYHQRISERLAEAAVLGQEITFQQARQFVWQELEDILLQTFLQIGPSNE